MCGNANAKFHHFNRFILRSCSLPAATFPTTTSTSSISKSNSNFSTTFSSRVLNRIAGCFRALPLFPCPSVVFSKLHFSSNHASQTSSTSHAHSEPFVYPTLSSLPILNAATRMQRFSPSLDPAIPSTINNCTGIVSKVSDSSLSTEDWAGKRCERKPHS